jgi:hypothetical protein
VKEPEIEKCELFAKKCTSIETALVLLINEEFEDNETRSRASIGICLMILAKLITAMGERKIQELWLAEIINSLKKTMEAHRNDPFS